MVSLYRDDIGEDRRENITVPNTIQLPVGASSAFVSLQLPAGVFREEKDEMNKQWYREWIKTTIDLPLKISVEDDPNSIKNDADAKIKDMVKDILGGTQIKTIPNDSWV